MSEPEPRRDRRMAPKGKLKSLPPGVREELDRRLVQGGFMNYRGLADWLGAQGCAITTAAVQRYGSKLERRLEAVKLATMQAKSVIEASPDDDNKINEALLRLVQQHLFTVLVELKTEDLSGVNVAALARSVAQIARAAIVQKKFTEEIRNSIEQKTREAGDKVISTVKAAARGGLSPQAEREIRKALLEIIEE